MIKNTIVAGTAIAVSGLNGSKSSSALIDDIKLKGNINHSACRWCYQKMPLEEMVENGKDLGLKSIELLNENEWDVVIKKGLTCAISNGSSLGITMGFNDLQYHDQLIKEYLRLIPKASEKGITQIICFSGNRGRISDKLGMEHCAVGLGKIIKTAEKYNVKIVMELLNSKVDHKDYMCDNSKWGIALVEKIGSSHFKLLYDIYHMQIMEGDVINTIKKYKDYISHFHTGGVPGRNEINESQELNYKAIMKAIAESGFKGYVAQEFIPTRKDTMESLKEGIKICDV